MKKITSLGWWSLLKTLFKYSAYIVIVIDGFTSIMQKIEDKEDA